MSKIRADQLLVDRGLVESRTRAQALIMAGLVFVGDRKVDKPGQAVADDVVLDVRGRDHPWVSRGGIKLAHGLDATGWDVTGAVAIDVGSSTGGFTDVLLQRGAARVYAVDSGTNQLAWSLRQDERVIVQEQTSARILTPAHIPEPVDLIVLDLIMPNVDGFAFLRQVNKDNLFKGVPVIVNTSFALGEAELAELKGYGVSILSKEKHRGSRLDLRRALKAAGFDYRQLGELDA